MATTMCRISGLMSLCFLLKRCCLLNDTPGYITSEDFVSSAGQPSNAGGSSDISEDLSLQLIVGQGHSLLLSEREMVEGDWLMPPDGLTLDPEGLVTAVSVTRVRGAYDILDVTEDHVLGLIQRKITGLVRVARSCMWSDPIQHGILHIWVPSMSWAQYVMDYTCDMILEESTLRIIEVIPILAPPDHPALTQYE